MKTMLLALLMASQLACSPTRGQQQQDSNSDTLTAVAADTSNITLAMTGDIMMGTTYPTPKLPQQNGRLMFSEVKDLLSSADLALGNLEGTFSEGLPSRKNPGPYSYSFSMPRSYGHYLVEAGFDYLSVANNHTWDFKDPGVLRTEVVLDSLGLLYSGAAGRRESVVIECKGVRVGIAAFCHEKYTLNLVDSAEVRRVIGDLKPRCDIMVVSIHGGGEGRDKMHLPYEAEYFQGDNRGYLRNTAHMLIDMGVDLVFGHGPHVVRCVEMYRGHVIAYSLGNFCTPVGINVSGVTGYAPVLEVTLDREGNFVSGRIHSFLQQAGFGPRRDDKHTAARQMRQLSLEDVPHSEAIIDNEGWIRKK
ncbi:MAG: CapA family protein [Prevotella sp.]|nr:CapA family protein [Prevotella sp.]